MSEIQYWLWLTLKKGITSRKITALLEHFQSPGEIYSADEAEFAEVPGLTRADVSVLADRSLQPVRQVMEVCRKKNIKIMTFDSPYYPRLLAEIYDPPYVLYARYKERIDLNTHMTLAIVGTRTCSGYGINMAERLAYDLAREGVTVISGMAKGIDGAAGTGALRAGGVTVAVLGSGVDICYPAVHKTLMEQIIEHGMVLSEYPPGSPPLASHFKPRNRIITGLSQGTVVVEAPVQSGAINSANWSLEQGRELFVVPGDVTRTSAQGSNVLMTEGALPALCAEDVLGEYRGRFESLLAYNRPSEEAVRPAIPAYSAVLTERRAPVGTAGRRAGTRSAPPPRKSASESAKASEAAQAPKPVSVPLSPRETAVLSLLTEEPAHADQLAEQGMTAAELASALTTLELKGLIRALPGRRYCLRR